jgi:hypothetical protein
MNFKFTFIFVVLFVNASTSISAQAVGKSETKNNPIKISKLNDLPKRSTSLVLQLILRLTRKLLIKSTLLDLEEVCKMRLKQRLL